MIAFLADENMKRMIPVLLILLSTFLLFYRLEALSLSVDEFVNVGIDLHPPTDILALLREGADLHPPLTHWLSHAWIQLFGESEWALRSIWSLCSVVTVALTYRLGVTLGNRRSSLWGALLLVTSPTFLLYARFVKYYALTMLLAMALILAFYYLRKSPARRLFFLYTFLLTAFLYTDYFGPVLSILWQDLFALWQFLRKPTSQERGFLKRLLGAQMVTGLLWSPWFIVALAQVKGVAGLQEADIGRGPLSFALKTIYAHYSFALGETILPWNLVALLGGIAFLAGWGSGLAVLISRSDSLAVWTGSFSFLSMGLIAGLTSSIITGVPFIAFANHILFAFPPFLLWLAAGISALRQRAFRWFTLGLLLASHVAGVLNYFTGREFHNPIYAMPTRDIVAQLAKETEPDDIVLAATDIGIDFYASRTSDWIAPILDTSDPQTVERLQDALPPRIWLFIFGRDRTREVTPTALQNFINDHCTLVEARGYVEQDSLLRSLKEWLFRRPAYQYKLSLYVYECPGGP